MTVNWILQNRQNILGTLLIISILMGVFLFPIGDILLDINSSQSNLLVVSTLFILYLIRPFVAAPLSMFSVLIGYRFGFPIGVGIAITGSTLSCVPSFIVARYLKSSTGIIGLLSKSNEKFVSSAGPLTSVLVARISPIPTDVVSYSLGLTKVTFRSYVLGTIVGLIPWATALVLLGYSMQELRLHEINLNLEFFTSMSLIAMLLLVSRIIQRKIIG